MAPTCPRSARTLVLLLLSWAAPAAAQPASATPSCETRLAEADAHYRQREHEVLEPLVLGCIYDSTAAPAEIERAYRLLALSFLDQGDLAGARAAVTRLVASAPAYRPDATLDLPVYVSLVESVREQMQPPARPSAPASAFTSALVDVNTATAEELDLVPGIGPALAGRIIAFRTAHGRFESVADLEAVQGIGPRSLEAMAPYLTAGPGRAAPPVPSDSPRASRPPVNINTASAEELTALDGIGPALAQRIVEYRTAYGPFRRLEDVTNVRGIGAVKLDALAGQATVE